MQCPECNGECWDNRQKISDQPDWRGPVYKCKDDECGWIKWQPKGKKSGGSKAPAAPKGPRWTWPMLSTYYRNSLAIAVKHVKKAIPDAKPEDILAGAHTVLIAATKGGVADPQPKPEPKPEPSYEEMPPALEDDSDSDSLPF